MTDDSERCEVVVIGGGVAGLAAAWHLRDRDVVLLECESRVGGRIRSEARGDLWLNFGAHVFSGADSAAGRLLAEVGVAAAPVPGRLAAVELHGRIVASGPVETYPLRLPLPLPERLALMRAGMKLRLAVRRYAAVAKPVPGEDPSVRQRRLLEFCDDRTFAELFGPLPADVDGLFRATLNRSSGEPEELQAGYGIGYFHLVWDRSGGLSRNVIGGSSRLTDALAAANRARVRLGARVVEVARGDAGVRVAYDRAGVRQIIEARAAIVATPADVTASIIIGLPIDTRAALESIPYGPYVVAAILTRERRAMPWDSIYALATPRRSFNMLFNTANVLRRDGPRQPGGSLMVYAGADLARPLQELDDERVAGRVLADLHEIYPETRRIVDEVVIQRWPRGLPFARPGRARLQDALSRPLGPIHLAGDYLGTWYTETAVQTAAAAAAAVRGGLER